MPGFYACCCFSVAVINITTKRNLEEEIFLFQLLLSDYSPSLREVRAGNLWQEL